MSKQNVFRLIRKEDVVLWAGAGLSMYAGYPSGNKLCEIIYDSLTKSEQEVINPNLSLTDLAEEFCRLKGRSKNPLIRILKERYETQKPSSTETHDIIASIPHFKTIITTNYDPLFELAYKGEIKKCIKDADISYIDDQLPHLFKIHGDLSDPDSIVITRTDYNNFIGRKRLPIMWSVLQERFSTKTILFVGYNLEDPNVSILFDRVCTYLGVHRKQIFFVSPNTPSHKIAHLASQGIQYIDSTGEDFFSALNKNIEEHIQSDFDKNLVSPDTYRRFLFHKGLRPTITSRDDQYVLKSLAFRDEKGQGNLQVNLRNDEDLKIQFKEILTGRKFGDIKLNEKDLIDTRIELQGIKFASKEDGLNGLFFSSVPKIDTKIDIEFEDGFNLSDIQVKVFGSPHKLEVIANYKNAKLSFSATKEDNTFQNVNLVFDPKGLIYQKVTDGINIYNLVKRIASGCKFTIYAKKDNGETINIPISERPTHNEEMLNYMETLLAYFKNLKTVEKTHQIRFSDIKHSEITETALTNVDFIARVIDNQIKETDWDIEIECELPENAQEETIAMLKKVQAGDKPIIAVPESPDLLKLHGKEITLGYREVEVHDPIIKNMDEIISKKSIKYNIASKTKTISIRYRKKTLDNS